MQAASKQELVKHLLKSPSLLPNTLSHQHQLPLPLPLPLNDNQAPPHTNNTHEQPTNQPPACLTTAARTCPTRSPTRLRLTPASPPSTRPARPSAASATRSAVTPSQTARSPPARLLATRPRAPRTTQRATSPWSTRPRTLSASANRCHQ